MQRWFFPVRAFQRAKEQDKQGRSSGVPSLTPFCNGFIYVILLNKIKWNFYWAYTLCHRHRNLHHTEGFWSGRNSSPAQETQCQLVIKVNHEAHEEQEKLVPDSTEMQEQLPLSDKVSVRSAVWSWGRRSGSGDAKAGFWIINSCYRRMKKGIGGQDNRNLCDNLHSRYALLFISLHRKKRSSHYTWKVCMLI